VKKLFAILTIILLSLSASAKKNEYKAIMKTGTLEQKYEYAIKCFNEKDYKKTIALLEDVQAGFRGTETAQHIIYYLAQSYIKKKDYESGIHYTESYLASYPRGEYVEECDFMLAYCHYKLSPDFELDQTSTYAAVDQLNKCLLLYPMSDKAADAKIMLEEMKDKLAQRELSNATLYYNLGMYRGNNYRAAVVTATNAMTDYPDCKYIEQFAYIIVKSKYKETMNSTDKMIYERCEDSADECYYFLNEYPDTKYRKEVEKMAATLNKIKVAKQEQTNKKKSTTK